MKPVRFFDQEFARRRPDQKYAPAARAEINRDVQ
jgi:hypothetical protein